LLHGLEKQILLDPSHITSSMDHFLSIHQVLEHLSYLTLHSEIPLSNCVYCSIAGYVSEYLLDDSLTIFVARVVCVDGLRNWNGNTIIIDCRKPTPLR
jgi:hypothetical protein